LATECRDLSLELGERSLAAQALLQLARASLGRDDSEQAIRLIDEAVALASEVNDAPTVAFARFNLGYVRLSAGDFVRAREEMDAARGAFVEIGDDYGVTRSLAALGAVALHERDPKAAVPLLRESLARSSTHENRDDIAWALQLLGVAAAATDAERAARLLGAAEALRGTLGLGLEGAELKLHERALNEVRSALGDETLSAAWAAGAALQTEEAVAEALAD
jgi:non-specific serine/threonine protein kinase